MKNLRVLVLLFSANSISGFATGVTMLAIPWTLVSTMGDQGGNFLNTAMMGIITFLTLFWGTYAGTLIDRYNRKKIFQVMNFSDFLIMSAIAGYGFYFQHVPFALMALVAGFTIFTYNVHYPNLYALVQELFEPQYYSKVNSAIELQGQVTNFIGMMVAGMLIGGSSSITWWPAAISIESWELWEIILLDGCTYFVSFLLISSIPYIPSKDKIIDKGKIVDRIMAGFKYLLARKPLLLFGITSYVIFATLLVFVTVVLPIYINDYLGFGAKKGAVIFANVEVWYAIGAFTAGMIGMILNRITNSINLIGQIIVLLFLTAFLYFWWSFTDSKDVLIFGGFLIGMTNAGTRILRITYIVRIVPNNMIGRVNSFFQVVNVVMRTIIIGIFALPFFSAQGNGSNVVYGLMIMGAVTFLSGLLLLFKFKTLDHEAAYG